MRIAACILSILFLCIGGVSGSTEQVRVVPRAWQTDPTDKTVPLVVSNRQSSITLTWSLKEAVPAGAWLRVCGASMACAHRATINEWTAGSDKTHQDLPVSRRFSREEQFKDWAFFVNNPFSVAGQPTAELTSNTQITATGKFAPMASSGERFSFRLETAPDWNGPWKAVSGWCTLNTVAGEPTSVEACRRSDGSLHILWVDRFTNPANPGQRKIAVCSLDGKEITTTTSDGKSYLNLSGERIPPEAERVSIKDDKGLQATSSAKPPKSIGNYSTYFGEIHFHTEYSPDAQRPIRDALNSARDEIGLDFGSPADHMRFTDGYNCDDYLDVLDEYNKPGSYVTLLGYEISGRCGHINPYYRDRAAAAKFDEAFNELTKDPRYGKADRLFLDTFFKHFSPDEIICIPHHTNHTSGKVVGPDSAPLWSNFDMRALDDRYMNVIEIVQVRGSFECEDIDKDWGIKAGGYGSSIRTALAMGHRFGIIGDTDNHLGWATRSQTEPGYAGMTGVQAPELTRDAIFHALKTRRTYATTGVRIALDFALNDEFPMGSEAKLVPSTKRNFKIMIRGTAPIDRAEIISQGAVLAKLQTNGTAELGRSTDLDVTWTDPRADAPIDNCYYYLRVRQTDGHCAWSSPIWVDYKE